MYTNTVFAESILKLESRRREKKVKKTCKPIRTKQEKDSRSEDERKLSELKNVHRIEVDEKIEVKAKLRVQQKKLNARIKEKLKGEA